MNTKTLIFLKDISNGFYKEMPLAQLADKILEMESIIEDQPLPEGLYITPDYVGVTCIPYRSEKISKEGEFTQYDDSLGHCGLCGSIQCRGTCFK